MFWKASDNSENERNARTERGRNLLPFGVGFLDDSLLGISKNDLVLIGAPSGVGKTALCCNIAEANLEAGKRVHYIALEAEEFEIESRIKYKIVSKLYFEDAERPRLHKKLSFDAWFLGQFAHELKAYEDVASKFFASAYSDLHVFYKSDKFNVSDLIETVVYCAAKTDLIIIDHVHYFDFGDDNENRAMKEIAKTARTLALENGKPIVLVAHLRKRDKFNGERCAGLDEFHGSSDLVKIATKVITLAPGRPVSKCEYETFFRTPKNRTNGSSTRFLGRAIYSSETGRYEREYRLGWAEQKREDEFTDIGESAQPDWARSLACPFSGRSHHDVPRQSKVPAAKRNPPGNRYMPGGD
jgi:archaellum biogenesis ATPase FlaH